MLYISTFKPTNNSRFIFNSRLFDNTTHCVGDVTDTRKLRNDFKSDTGFNIKHEIFYVYGKDILNVGTLWSNKSGVEQPDIERFGDIKQCETSNPAPSLNDLIAGFAVTMYNDGTMDLKHTPYNGIPIVIETVDSCSKLTYNYSIRIGGVAYALSKLFPVPISKHTILRTILVSKACASRAVEQCSKLLNKFVECEVCNHCKAAEHSRRLVNKRLGTSGRYIPFILISHRPFSMAMLSEMCSIIFCTCRPTCHVPTLHICFIISELQRF